MWSLVTIRTWHCIRALDDRFALGSATFMFQVMELVAGVLGINDLTTPGVEPGLSRPRRDVLATRRCGLLRDIEPRAFCSLATLRDKIVALGARAEAAFALGAARSVPACLCQDMERAIGKGKRHLWDSNPRGETPSA